MSRCKHSWGFTTAPTEKKPATRKAQIAEERERLKLNTPLGPIKFGVPMSPTTDEEE